MATGDLPQPTGGEWDPAAGIGYLERLAPGAPAYVFDQAEQVLCRTFGPSDDRDYTRAYRKEINRVRKGTLKPEVLVYAFRQAIDPSATHRGESSPTMSSTATPIPRR
jgi:hypothetical protein